jgi:chemotaxis protein MotA
MIDQILGDTIMRSILPGILLIIAVALFASFYEKIPLGSLIQWHNMVLVWGGSFGVAVLGFGFKKSLKMFNLGFLNSPADQRDLLVQEWEVYAEYAAKKGIISLEHLVSECDNIVGKIGLRLLADNKYSVSELEATLNSVMEREFRNRSSIADMWGTVAEKGPFVGIVGTVLSMFNLWSGTDLSQMGAGIAIAFTATLYGLGLAVVATPLASRIGRHAEIEKENNLLIISAVKAISQGKSRIHVRNILQGA